MSKTQSIRFASEHYSLAQVLQELATGVSEICSFVSSSLLDICKDVFKNLKNLPIENLQVTFTPINDISTFGEVLQDNGFDISLSNLPNMLCASNSQNQSELFIIHSDEGIGVVSNNEKLVISLLQDLTTQKVVEALKEEGFEVQIDKKGDEKVIIAENKKERDKLSVKIKKDRTTFIDTRSVKRPKCDIIHQLIKERLQKGKKQEVGIRIQALTRKNERFQIHLKNNKK